MLSHVVNFSIHLSVKLLEALKCIVISTIPYTVLKKKKKVIDCGNL